MHRRPVDGTWVRMGLKGGVRCAWCAVEETGRLMAKPAPRDWTEDWLTEAIPSPRLYTA